MWYTTLTKEEKAILSQIACDEETGNHLLHPRSAEYRALRKELMEAMDVPVNELTNRQFTLLDNYGTNFWEIDKNGMTDREKKCFNAVGGRWGEEHKRVLEWADANPNGFICDYHSTKDLTNKEFIELLKQYPEDAYISVECCNPRAMVYDIKNNLIRID